MTNGKADAAEQRAQHAFHAHGLPDVLLPGLPVAVQLHGVANGFGQGPGSVLVEEEARDAVLHRVGQATHPPDHRERPVALGPHLGEAARLVLRRHEKDVRASE